MKINLIFVTKKYFTAHEKDCGVKIAYCVRRLTDNTVNSAILNYVITNSTCTIAFFVELKIKLCNQTLILNPFFSTEKKNPNQSVRSLTDKKHTSLAKIKTMILLSLHSTVDTSNLEQVYVSTD